VVARVLLIVVRNIHTLRLSGVLALVGSSLLLHLECSTVDDKLCCTSATVAMRQTKLLEWALRLQFPPSALALAHASTVWPRLRDPQKICKLSIHFPTFACLLSDDTCVAQTRKP
jgi:hypothetical protein